MAFRPKFKNRENINKDLIFDGGIQSHTRCLLVKEFFKYILYERQQIPVPYEQVKQGFKNVEREEQSQQHISQTKRKSSHVSKMERKKISQLINGLDEMFGKLVETFDICPEVREVLILFGGTVVSPKESYMISFPPYHPESNNLSSKFCVRYLLKELIGQDFVGKLKDLRTTNAVFMVKAPVDSGISWFLPKPNFSPPTRGQHVSFNLISNPNSDVFIHDLTHEENEIEISGIEPFDVSCFDTSVEEQMMKLFISTEIDNSFTDNYKRSVLASVEKARRLSSVNKKFSSFFDEDTCTENSKFDNSKQSTESSKTFSSSDKTFSSLSDDDTLLQKTMDTSNNNAHKSDGDKDCIWYQAPYIIKGYKDKSTSKSSDLTWKYA